MIYSSLYNSNAYRDLKPISKDIYIGMVLYAKGNFITEYPHRIYKNIGSKGTFQTAIKELVEHGFIEIISSGKLNHKPNEYKFCDNCKDACLKYCDRFYCRRLNVAQISVKGKKKNCWK